ncbi:hypothetical protein D3C75_1291890 [compost metagenome]
MNHTGWIWTALAEHIAAERGLDERKADAMVDPGHLIPGYDGRYYARQSWISKGYVQQV